MLKEQEIKHRAAATYISIFTLVTVTVILFMNLGTSLRGEVHCHNDHFQDKVVDGPRSQGSG